MNSVNKIPKSVWSFVHAISSAIALTMVSVFIDRPLAKADIEAGTRPKDGRKTTWPSCWGCNAVKGGYPERSTRQLLDALAAGEHTSLATMPRFLPQHRLRPRHREIKNGLKG